MSNLDSRWTPYSSPISSDSGYLTSVESGRRHSATPDTMGFNVSGTLNRLMSIDASAPGNDLDDDNELQHGIFSMSLDDISVTPVLASSPDSRWLPQKIHDRNPFRSLSTKPNWEMHHHLAQGALQRHSVSQKFSSRWRADRHGDEEVLSVESNANISPEEVDSDVREINIPQLLPDILPQFEIRARSEDLINSEYLNIREAAVQLRQVGDEFQLSHSPARSLSSNLFTSRPISIQSRNNESIQPIQQAQSLVEDTPSEGRDWMRRFSLPPGSLSVAHLLDRWLGANNND